MEFTQWERRRLAQVLGDMAGTPAQVDQVAPLMDQLEAAAADDQRATALLPGADLANVQIQMAPTIAALLLRACMIWQGWTVRDRAQMRALLADLRLAAEDQLA